jgi:TetR/AcrR family transcriptional regulator
VTRPKASAKKPLRLSAGNRRQQLIQVAVDLFSRKGFKGTTTREIAAAAGVTEAIIFRHFETKEQLYTAIIDQRLNSPDATHWMAGLRAAMDRDDDEAVIRQLIDVIILTHKTDPKFERLMLYAALEGNEIALRHLRLVTASIVDLYRKYFLRRQKQGSLRPCVPDVALTAIAGMAQNYALGKYVHELKEQCLSDEQAVESFTRIAMDGLRGLKPPKRSLLKKK